MEINVNTISSDYNFMIRGASYAGTPKSNTVMFITKKVEHLVEALDGVEQCLVYAENGIFVSDTLKAKLCFMFSDNPQFEYAKFATHFSNQRMALEASWGYELTDGQYYLGKNCKIGKNACIEPGVLIGHGVVIGDNAVILSGSVIKNAVIGDNFLCNERAVVGSMGFTMAEDEEGNKYRIPSLGRLVVGNSVEIGACCNVAVGTCGDTIIGDFVKLDALVHIGHESCLERNIEITAGVIVSGFVEIEEGSWLGVNSSIKNRIHLGHNCLVGMGATVIKPVPDGYTVAGNPAKPLGK